MPIIQSVERALRILNLFDEYNPELKITEISKRMTLNKSTVHSLLKTLQKHQYIEQDLENGKYKLGIKLFERGNFVVNNLDIRSIARKHLLNLSQQTGYTVHLVILSGKEGVYIDKVEGPSATIRYSRIGRRIPIHCSGVGKALISFQDDQQLSSILNDYDYIRQTENTITNETDLLEEVQRVRENGYATDIEENEPGVSCVAVPIFGYMNKPIAAISMSMPSPRFDQEDILAIVRQVQEVGQEISHEMGYSGTPVNEV